MAQGLPCHQNVIRSDPFAAGFEGGAHRAREAGGGGFKRQNKNRPNQKGLKPLAGCSNLHLPQGNLLTYTLFCGIM